MSQRLNGCSTSGASQEEWGLAKKNGGSQGETCKSS